MGGNLCEESPEAPSSPGTACPCSKPLCDHAEPEGKGEDATTALRRARFLRVKITESATGSVRLETRLPSQFVDGMAMVIPQVRASPDNYRAPPLNYSLEHSECVTRHHHALLIHTWGLAELHRDTQMPGSLCNWCSCQLCIGD